jgi:hypothetical protein
MKTAKDKMILFTRSVAEDSVTPFQYNSSPKSKNRHQPVFAFWFFRAHLSTGFGELQNGRSI